jgi:hypothetical protein
MVPCTLGDVGERDQADMKSIVLGIAHTNQDKSFRHMIQMYTEINFGREQ